MIGRMLVLRFHLVLASDRAEQSQIRRRMWSLPGFRTAYEGRLADTREELLDGTPY